jgi:hypothetical protein
LTSSTIAKSPEKVMVLSDAPAKRESFFINSEELVSKVVEIEKNKK